MRRPAKGGTTRPLNSRPGHGYGRPLRPDPNREPKPQLWHDPDWWSAIELEPSSRSEVMTERR
jgi:hypothetical protein